MNGQIIMNHRNRSARIMIKKGQNSIQEHHLNLVLVDTNTQATENVAINHCRAIVIQLINLIQSTMSEKIITYFM